MIILFTILHVIVCLFLVIVVLLQSGKAADLAGAFGGMGSQTAFGPRGAATLLSKATTISAAVFMITSLTLSVLYTRAGGGVTGTSVLEKAKAPVTQSAPKQPTPAAPANGQQSPIKVDMQTEGGKSSTQQIPLPNAPQQAPAAPKK